MQYLKLQLSSHIEIDTDACDNERHASAAEEIFIGVNKYKKNQ